MDFQFSNATGIAVFGTRGGGKSNFIQWLMSLLTEKGGKYLIFDYVQDYDAKWGKVCHKLSELLKYRYLGQLIFQYPDLDEHPEVVDSFFKLVYHHFRDFFVVCEETDRYAHSKSSQTSPFMTFINLGRHKNQGYAVVSRRLGNLKLDCTAFVDYIISFFQFVDVDIQRLGTMLSKEIANEVPKLEEHHYLLFNVKTQNLNQGEKWDIFPPCPLMEDEK